ncbi:isomerase [Anaerocolumna cellulosilytica]|uniref:Isomerase n=1 Tax=Anaerocolumna cellulosilytica TaxID=433286 RepID=A0A6S6QSW5_9FIRM|nr:PhzF family phenazine biosynthesis isomerase [Anaerocolumna cellulosilytica]MBB5196006.1 PhzF family phenazine biosynthesis protein [Anaerocolumna cellulosilytica]BCJ93694.1 isomerase [Anaerocolumna cellulosilytica]
MKSIKIYHYDAFSAIPNKGNPAGVVFDGDKLSTEKMQQIAFKVGFNETAFPLTSDNADLRIRYFTPGHEINLCGHATMATIYALKTNRLLEEKSNLSIETKAGILPINILNANGDTAITMRQTQPEFKTYNGSKEDLALSMGLSANDLDESLPILYGSTGAWTLLVPIKKLETFKRMQPNNKIFPDILKEMPRTSVHPFCLETYDREKDMHARHFSSPYSGTVEDPVTGTASGVMGAYYATYMNHNFDKTLTLTVEQGQEIGRDGQVTVMITKNLNTYDIAIVGNAVYVKEFEINL